ncbi:serine/threonine-protein kinase [Novosphingobium sp.]|uniref:serine/threonine-protein kinase n=1 Tax=Novosphingobium sp. TaxID=1874826 RepID=UPI0035B08A99
MRIKDRYEYDPVTDLLGKGGFARVFRARDELLNRDVALKVFSKLGHDQYSVLAEIRKAIQLEHPNLLRYYDVLLLSQANALGEEEELQVGVMEYANAGDLKSFVRANPGTDQLPRLLREVLQGLEYLHSRGIIHRDLKAQNILLVERGGVVTAKISDFGISKDLSGSDPHSSSMLVGTIEYMAPEQFYPGRFGIDGKVQSNADLWGFGVMIHDLLTDTTPFGRRDGDTTVEQIMAAIVEARLPEQLDELAEPYRSVVRQCLVADARQRIRRASDLLGYFGGDAGTAAYAPPPASDDTVPMDRAAAGSGIRAPRRPGLAGGAARAAVGAGRGGGGRSGRRGLAGRAWPAGRGIGARRSGRPAFRAGIRDRFDAGGNGHARAGLRCGLRGRAGRCGGQLAGHLVGIAADRASGSQAAR